MVRVTQVAALVLAASLQLIGGAASQQTFPTRTVRFILPFGAGSASDTTARLFAERLSARWGKPVVVENRPGGDGLVSLDAFVGAHDDHIMWFGPAGAFNVLPYQHDTLPFDLKRDLNPVVSVSQVVLAISMPASMKVNSIDQLVTMARAQPGKLNAAAANGISDFLDPGIVGIFRLARTVAAGAAENAEGGDRNARGKGLEVDGSDPDNATAVATYEGAHREVCS
jgi:tripartite-type tricarboxylate transporter receptor subunit TctC